MTEMKQRTSELEAEVARLEVKLDEQIRSTEGYAMSLNDAEAEVAQLRGLLGGPFAEAIRAAVAAEHERTREACAKTVEKLIADHADKTIRRGVEKALPNIAAAIRAMPEHDPEREKE